MIADIAFHLPQIVKSSWQPLLRPVFCRKPMLESAWRQDILSMLRRTLFANLWAANLSILVGRCKNAETSAAYLFILVDQ